MPETEKSVPHGIKESLRQSAQYSLPVARYFQESAALRFTAMAFHVFREWFHFLPLTGVWKA
jgi:hypothetical protein